MICLWKGLASWASDLYSHTGSCALKSSALDMMLCHCHFEFLNNFRTRCYVLSECKVTFFFSNKFRILRPVV